MIDYSFKSKKEVYTNLGLASLPNLNGEYVNKKQLSKNFTYSEHTLVLFQITM